MERSEMPFMVSLRWVQGVVYIILVAVIWIAASFVVQSVVDTGVSPFLITYICNSLFVVYIPIVESGNVLKNLLGQRPAVNQKAREVDEKVPVAREESERENLLGRSGTGEDGFVSDLEIRSRDISSVIEKVEGSDEEIDPGDGTLAIDGFEVRQDGEGQVERWSRERTALVGLWICPFWFLAQLTFNFSLRYTTVTSNTVLSTTSTLFTLLVSVSFLKERFTWWKLSSVLLCMSGSVVVALGDSQSKKTDVAPNPVLGDCLALLSAMFYAVYTAMIRAKISDEDEMKGKCSTALVLGFLGLFNALFFGPIALLLHFTNIEPFHRLTLTQVGLIVGKGLLDNVLSDYLWAKAVLLTSPTVATAGLSVQVPLAALVDSIRGSIPSPVNVMGAIVVLIGFFGINRSSVPEDEARIGGDNTDGATLPRAEGVDEGLRSLGSTK